MELNDTVITELNERDYRGGIFVTGSGNSTARRLGYLCGATPDGRLQGKAASVSLGPSTGADRKGPTAMLNSVAKLDWKAQAGGALTHIRMPYTGGQRPAGVQSFLALTRVFFQKGGMGLHCSVVTAESLRQAMKNPEQHLNLLVRMGGFSVPFVLAPSRNSETHFGAHRTRNLVTRCCSGGSTTELGVG